MAGIEAPAPAANDRAMPGSNELGSAMLWNIPPTRYPAKVPHGRPELYLPAGASGAVIVDLQPGRLRPWDLIGVVTVDAAGQPQVHEQSQADEQLGLAAECLRQWARATGTVGPVRIFLPAC